MTKTEEMATERNAMWNDRERLLIAVNDACRIIERADTRNLHDEGPAGGRPPQMTLAEWKELYTVLNKARK